jgi:hypothetical protein
MPKSLMVVLTNPTSEEQRAEFENWYDERHLAEIARLPGVVSATRYQTMGDLPVMPGLPGVGQASLAIYELEAQSDDALRAVSAAMQEAMADESVYMSPTLDMATALAFFAVPTSETMTAG